MYITIIQNTFQQILISLYKHSYILIKRSNEVGRNLNPTKAKRPWFNTEKLRL